jgi:hypothetical protein
MARAKIQLRNGEIVMEDGQATFEVKIKALVQICVRGATRPVEE